MERARVAWWQWPNVLSLDAPVVAVVWLWLIGTCERMVFLREIYVAVFLVVWAVYLLDRLVDAWRAGDGTVATETARRAFYRKFLVPMLVVFGLVSAAALALVFFRVPQRLAEQGMVASVMVWLYLALSAGRVNPVLGATAIALGVGSGWFGFYLKGMNQMVLSVVGAAGAMLVLVASQKGAFERSPVIPKEVICGVAFAVGVGLPVFVYNSSGWQEMVVTPWMWQFAGLCVLNCLAISVMEEREDREARDLALPQVMPGVAAVVPVGLALVAGVSGWGALQGAVLWPVSACVAASAGLLLVLFLVRGRLGREAFRVLADGVLLTPLAFLPMLSG